MLDLLLRQASLSSGYLAVEGDGLVPGDGHVEGVLQDGGGAAGQAGGHQGQGGCVDNQGMAHGGGCPAKIKKIGCLNIESEWMKRHQ